MLVEKHQQLYHTILESYIDQQQNQYKMASINSFNTRYVSLTLIVNKIIAEG